MIKSGLQVRSSGSRETFAVTESTIDETSLDPYRLEKDNHKVLYNGVESSIHHSIISNIV